MLYKVKAHRLFSFMVLVLLHIIGGSVLMRRQL
ncbi:hypothetical protein G4B88_027907 [Cannabis sativa]|uniref:Uncharacterized protein n=1 Tax=Cannabis sativa TaxID=3483 RepID=A0A7J6I755_CANSA|nr:hypothetical protein G4B88_027907 [Cannabis sativa]